MNALELGNLAVACKEMSSCDECTKEMKAQCREFKRVIVTVKEPWELPRLFEGGDEK